MHFVASVVSQKVKYSELASKTFANHRKNFLLIIEGGTTFKQCCQPPPIYIKGKTLKLVELMTGIDVNL